MHCVQPIPSTGSIPLQERRGEHQRLASMDRLPFVGCRDVGDRFPISIRLLYRPQGARDWREGWTENMSRSGVLFRTREVLDPETPIELRLVVQFDPSLAPAPEIVCAGRVVRKAEPDVYHELVGVAAQFTGYRFLQAQEALRMFQDEAARQTPERMN